MQNEEVERQLQVTKALERLWGANNYLSDTIDTLELRLQSIITPPLPKDAETGHVEDPALVKLASDICTEVDRVNYASQRIQELLDRMEL